MCRQCYSPTPVAEVPLPAAPTRRGLLKGLAAGTSALALAGCVPSGLGTAFAPPPREIERLADASWARILQERRVWTNAAANQRAQRVAQRLIPLAGGPSRAWEVVLFDDASVNAFALPNGKIGIHRGMMQAVENDDQLAAVIGHELGHVTANHAAQRVGTSQFSNLLAAGVGAAVGVEPGSANQLAALLGLGAQVGIILPFSRGQELEADEIGVAYMARAGYDPVEALNFWTARMAEGGPARLEMLSTHPSDQARIANLQRLVAQA